GWRSWRHRRCRWRRSSSLQSWRRSSERMGAAVEGNRAAGADPGAGCGEARRGTAPWRDFVELTKPGITRLVLLTTGAGYYLAVRGAPDLAGLVHTLVGAGLVASGTNALNQYL